MSQYLGQIVLGPPGSGKTTYCLSMSRFLCMNRKIPILINLDPGNIMKIHQYKIDICQLVISYEISCELHLGPNGSIFYSMEYFEKNLDWFEKKLKKITKTPLDLYFLFDLPGQIELYTHHFVIRNFIKKINKKKKIQLAAIVLNDLIFWKDKTVIFSILIISISIMLNIELPYINLLSKADLFLSKTTINFVGLKSFQNFVFTDLFLQNSIFFWANKFYKNLNDIIFDFSSLSTFTVNNYNINDMKNIFIILNNILSNQNTN